jgi:hypothetical protein
MITVVHQKDSRRLGSGSALETMSYCPLVAVGMPGRKSWFRDLRAAEARTGRGESP